MSKQQIQVADGENDAEIMAVLQNSLYPGAAQASIRMVLGYCRAAGLDPMQKPVHIVPMYDAKTRQMRDVIMPGIGLYRTQAARNGCAGVSEPDFGPDVTAKVGGQQITYPTWCRVTARRRLVTGEVVEFTAKELWIENYAVKGGAEKSQAPNAMWTKRTYGQLAKCAEAQALRKAFPEIGSEPTADEMVGKSINDEYAEAVQTTTAQREPAALPAYTSEEFDANLSKWRDLIDGGKSTAARIIAMVGSKMALTEQQKRRITELEGPPPGVDPNTGEMLPPDHDNDSQEGCQ